MQAIRRTSQVADGAMGRKVYDAVVKSDMSEGVAWVDDDDVNAGDELITEAEYDTYAASIRAWNEANIPAPTPDPAEEAFDNLVQLLGPDWAASEAAWAGLTATDKANHLRARTNALRDAVLWLYDNIANRDTSGME